MAKEKPRGPIAWGYSRVSTAGQAEFGKSLEMQREKLKGYYDKNLAGQAVWGDVFVDAGRTAGKKNGVSGKTKLANRPAGSQLVARLRPGDPGRAVTAVSRRAGGRAARDVAGGSSDSRGTPRRGNARTPRARLRVGPALLGR